MPVITGNDRLWHSHKIKCSVTKSCSKASTANFPNASWFEVVMRRLGLKTKHVLYL